MIEDVEITEEDDKVIRLTFPGSSATAGSNIEVLYEDDNMQLVRLNWWFGPWFFQPYFLLPA